jgi:hypothetical protein
LGIWGAEIRLVVSDDTWQGIFAWQQWMEEIWPFFFFFSGAIGGFGLRGFCLLGHSGCLGEKGSFFFILGLLGCGVVIIMGLDSVFFSCFHLSFSRASRTQL